MTSIAAIQHQISQIEQHKQVKEQEITKLHQRSVQEAANDEQDKAAGDQQRAHHERQEVEQYDKQIHDLQRQLSDLERQIANIDAKLKQRYDQFVGDQQRLEQTYKTDIQQLESEKLRLIG